MNTRITFLAAACALALAACGDKAPNTADTTADTTANTPAAVETAPTSTTPPAETAGAAPTSAAAAPGSDKPAAVVSDCATVIEGNDAMQYNVGSITIPASCSEFKITLKHTGQMPIAAMGHNVVITAAADMQAVAADGMGAGVESDYLKPGDERVIAHTSLVGGGETTSVSFPVSKLQGDGPYEFFCSFPAHSTVMKGVIAVE